MIRGVYIQRSPYELTTICAALDRYAKEVTSTKRHSTQESEKRRLERVKKRLGCYMLATFSPDILAAIRDDRLEEGKSASTVRLELALLGHLYSVAMKEWGLGIVYNPVVVGCSISAGQLDAKSKHGGACGAPDST